MIKGEVGKNISMMTLLEVPAKSAGMFVKHMFPMLSVGTDKPVMDRANKVHWKEGWQLAISDSVAIQKREGKFYLCLGV